MHNTFIRQSKMKHSRSDGVIQKTKLLTRSVSTTQLNVPEVVVSVSMATASTARGFSVVPPPMLEFPWTSSFNSSPVLQKTRIVNVLGERAQNWVVLSAIASLFFGCAHLCSHLQKLLALFSSISPQAYKRVSSSWCCCGTDVVIRITSFYLLLDELATTPLCNRLSITL
jgi:hypothetical protein